MPLGKVSSFPVASAAAMSISLQDLLAKKSANRSVVEETHSDTDREAEVAFDANNNENEHELGAETNLEYFEDELEMPGSSLTVGADDEDVFAMLSGTKERTSGKFKSAAEHDIVELYSTIAFLKKENQELVKEVEFVKRSKDATFKDMQTKLETQIAQLRNENRDLQAVIHRKDDEITHLVESKGDDAGLKAELERVIAERETLEAAMSRQKDDQGGLRADLMTSKTEINRLKMELGRMKGDLERVETENDDLKSDLKLARAEMDKTAASRDDQSRQLVQDIKRLEEQLHLARGELAEKSQIMGKMNEDLVALDRNLQQSHSQNMDLKQRVGMLEMVDRDLQNARYRISSLEGENNDLINEVGRLRSQLQLSSGYSSSRPNSSSYLPPSSLPSQTAHSANYSHHHVPPPPPVAPAPSQYTSNNYHYNEYSRPAPAPPAVGMVDKYQLETNSDDSRPNSNRSTPKSLSNTLGDVENLRRSVSSNPYGGGYQQQQQQQADPVGARNRDSLGAVLSGNAVGNNGSSLASLLQSKKQVPNAPVGGGTNRRPGDTPFATEKTSREIMVNYEIMERELTQFMTEKTSLQEESEK